MFNSVLIYFAVAMSQDLEFSQLFHCLRLKYYSRRASKTLKFQDRYSDSSYFLQFLPKVSLDLCVPFGPELYIL